MNFFDKLAALYLDEFDGYHVTLRCQIIYRTHGPDRASQKKKLRSVLDMHKDLQIRDTERYKHELLTLNLEYHTGLMAHDDESVDDQLHKLSPSQQEERKRTCKAGFIEHIVKMEDTREKQRLQWEERRQELVAMIDPNIAAQALLLPDDEDYLKPCWIRDNITAEASK